MPIRLYPDPSADGRVGIPRKGELFEREDAERLIGQGIATRSRKAAEKARDPKSPPPETPAEGEE
jgi:hypothetical protein